MKYLLIVIAIMSWRTSFAQQISYQKWQEEAKTEIRLLPEYGNALKTKEQKEADERLIKTELEQNGTHRKASEALVKLGFDYLYRGDIRTAMYRFNQAWLLDPKNENAYWGFGAIYFTFNEFQKALFQYDKGLTINPGSSVILTDKATVYMDLFSTTNNKEYLDKAKSFFIQSYKIDPKNQNTLFKLSAYYLSLHDCVDADRYYKECMKLGGDPITKEYTEALKKECGK